MFHPQSIISASSGEELGVGESVGVRSRLLEVVRSCQSLKVEVLPPAPAAAMASDQNKSHRGAFVAVFHKGRDTDKRSDKSSLKWPIIRIFTCACDCAAGSIPVDVDAAGCQESIDRVSCAFCS